MNTADSYYNLHGMMTFRCTGTNSLVRDLVNRELQYFESQSGKPDLSLVFGEFPSSKWEPRGFASGERLLYDSDSHETTILLDPRATPTRNDVKYVVRGDLRTSKDEIAIYVPRIRHPKRKSRPMTLARSLINLNLNDAYQGLFAEDSLYNQYYWGEAGEILSPFVEGFIYYRLPSLGFSILHASAVSLNGSGVLFTGPADVGKTTMALQLVSQGYSFLGDDLVLLGREGNLLSYPVPLKLEWRHQKVFPSIIKTMRRNLAPKERKLFDRLLRTSPKELFEFLPRPILSDLFDNARIEKECSIDTVFVIKRGMIAEPKITKIDMATLEREVTSSLFWEFNTQGWRFIQYNYCSSYARGLDFLKEEVEHHSRVAKIVSEALVKVRAFELQLPSSFDVLETGKLVEKLIR